MKTLKLLKYVSILFLFVRCGSDDNTSESTDELNADFTFTNEGSTFIFTNLSDEGLTYRWDFGDLSFISDERNPVYTYDIGGELTVSLTVTDENSNQGFVAKNIIAPEIIIIDITVDGEFEDWEDVPVALEFTSENLSIKKMKFWTKGEFIHFYFEGGSDMELPVVDMVFNTDGDATTGYNENWGIGAEYLYEGPTLIPAWGALYEHIGPGGGFSWNPIASEGFVGSGVIVIDENTNAAELSVPKNLFGTLGDTIGFGMFVNYGEEFYPEDRSGDPITIEIE